MVKLNVLDATWVELLILTSGHKLHHLVFEFKLNEFFLKYFE